MFRLEPQRQALAAWSMIIFSVQPQSSLCLLVMSRHQQSSQAQRTLRFHSGSALVFGPFQVNEALDDLIAKNPCGFLDFGLIEGQQTTVSHHHTPVYDNRLHV